MDAPPETPASTVKLSRKCLTGIQKKTLLMFLQLRSTDGKLDKGAVAAAVEQWGVKKTQVYTLWNEAKKINIYDREQFESFTKALSPKKKQKCGRHIIPLDHQAIKKVPKNKRGSIRGLEAMLITHGATCSINVETGKCDCKPLPGHSKTSLHRKLKSGLMKRVSSSLKPLLNDGHRKIRVVFIIGWVDPNSLPHTPSFLPMFFVIHVDEKWFYITLVDRTFYLCLDEEAPLRMVKHKSHLQKIMFIAAVARPRFQDGHCTFDGKIGIWPFLEEVPAKKASKNRPKGTLELKPVNISKSIYRDMMINNILPAIRERWPDGNTYAIEIQQDNARPHIDTHDEVFLAEASKFGFKIKMTCQPAQSPDMNVCDLGFFRSIQSKQHQNASNTMEELRDAVIKAYWEMPPYYLNKVWLSLQQCMIETLKCDGNNSYKLPHISKDKLFREGNLPLTLSFDRFLYANMVDKFCSPDSQNVVGAGRCPPPRNEFIADEQFCFNPESDSESDAELELAADAMYMSDIRGRTIVI